MKTVIDAVNEYMADISGSKHKSSNGDLFVIGSHLSRVVKSSYSTTCENLICTEKQFNQCVEEMTKLVKPSKPVYTQAMADKGILPSVGMECLVQLSKNTLPEKCEVIGLFNKEAWVLLYDGMCTHSFKIKDYSFTCIETRADEEKAIEDLENEYDTTLEWSELLKSIKAGKIHNVTWSK